MAAVDLGAKNIDALIKKLTAEKDKQAKIASDASLQASALSNALTMALDARDALTADIAAAKANPDKASAGNVG